MQSELAVLDQLLRYLASIVSPIGLTAFAAARLTPLHALVLCAQNTTVNAAIEMGGGAPSLGGARSQRRGPNISTAVGEAQGGGDRCGG